MTQPPSPPRPSWDEAERLAALHRYDILDTGGEIGFDELVQLAAQICDVPMSAISLVAEDRQWFKSQLGLGISQTPRDISFCTHAIQQRDLFEVQNAQEHPLFTENPLVTQEPHLRFYAGMPLETSEGLPLGTLCVLDCKPRQLEPHQVATLRALARQVMTQLELRRTLNEKRVSEARLQLALNASGSIGTWDWDVVNDKVYVDARFSKLFSVSPQQATLGAPVREFYAGVHPDDRMRLEIAVQRAIASREDFSLEYRLQQADESVMWVLARGRCYYDHQGQPVRFPGVLIDISEQKRAEARQAALVELGDRLRDLKSTPEIAGLAAEILGRVLHGVRAGYGKVDEGEAFVTVERDWTNGRADSAMGIHRFTDYGSIGEDLKRGELLAVEDVACDPRTAAHAEQYTTLGIRSLLNVPLIEQRKLAAILYLHDDKPRHWSKDEIAFMREVAERTWVAAERISRDRALRELRLHLTRIIESAREFAILAIDLQGNISTWSAGAERLFGYGQAETVGQPISMIFTPEDVASGIDRTEIETAALLGRVSDERWHRRKDGTRFFASAITEAMYDELGELIGFTKIARDVTMQKEAEAQLIQARNVAEAANLAKSEFLANMSHEIRTPMNAVIGLANILAQSEGLTERQREFIHTLQLSADALLALLNDLLDISKIEARSVELEQIPFNVAQLVQEVVGMMGVRAQEKRLTILFDGDVGGGRQHVGDPTRLRQIVTNLCSNAIKFTEAGGVQVSVSFHPSPLLGVEEVRIAVKDTGIGVAPEHLSSIFEKFVQADNSISRKYGGTGLGLAITKTLTEIMGGTITLESAPNEGSTFTITLPLRRDDRVDSSSTVTTSPMPPISPALARRVLLVEDYAPNVLVAGTFLDQFGYSWEVAENGYEAVEKATSGRFALALMDVQMHGMNGLEATQRIRAHEQETSCARLPIIGMTAHALAGDKDRCLEAGMDDYLPKPFDPQELRQKLEAALAEPLRAVG